MTGAPIAAITCVVFLGAVPARSGADEVVVDSNAYPEDDAETSSDGFLSLLDHEAREALAAGKLRRAWYLYHRVVDLQPENTAAWRELGRVGAALGASNEAIRILGMVHERQGHAPDPELHFIRGQALVAVGRKADGLAELALAERELATATPSRQRTLWLARIHALRGDADEAERLYRSLLPQDVRSAEFEEISLQLIEAHIIAREWKEAEERLRVLIATRPGHQRARDMLAWVLESRGKLDQELALRGALAQEWSTEPGRFTAEHARALERAHKYEAALDRYRWADELGVDVEAAINRVEGYLAPEVAAAAGVFTDPQGERFSSMAGASVPITSRLRMVGAVGYETVSAATVPGLESDEARLVMGLVWGIYELGRGNELGLGAVGWHNSDRGADIGALAFLRTSPHRRWNFYGRGEASSPWRESAATVREGGSVDMIEVQLYVSPFTPRLVFMAGGRARRLVLPAFGFYSEEDALQLFGATGIDFVVSQNDNMARGQMFDDELLGAVSMAGGLVLSYRHYEMESDDPFGARLSLVERSSLDELSATMRHIVDGEGVLSVQAQAGFGYDNQRELWRWRGGALLYLSPTERSRLVLSFETASESTTGLTGRRYAGMLGFHVDI